MDDTKAAPAMKTVMQLSGAAEVAARFKAEASASMSSISGDDDITGSTATPDRRSGHRRPDNGGFGLGGTLRLYGRQLVVAIRTAIVAAGATRIDLAPSSTNPIDAWQKGQVDAAVLGVVSPDATELFSAIASYRMFRVPISAQ